MEKCLRIAKIEDKNSIIKCINAAYEKFIERIGKKPAPMITDYKPKIESKYVHVIEKNNTIIGIIVLIPKEDHLYLGNLAVHPSKQGQGFGRKLMVFAEKHAISLGLNEIRLFTNEVMHEVIALYKKNGYREINRKTERGYNRVFLSKPLNAEPLS